jgi:ABC transporter substrate binding protein
MTVSRRALTVTLIFGLLGALLAADAQPVGKVYRIGLLTTHYRPDDTGPVAFRQELRKLGWIEGQNIVIEVRSAEGKAERLPELAADLVRLKVDVISAMGDLAAVPASQATRTIPIVAGSADPVGIGLVTNLARPEGNVTGLHIQAAETAGKRLQLLKEVVPTVSRVAVLWNATHRLDQTLGTRVRPPSRQDQRETRLELGADDARTHTSGMEVVVEGASLGARETVASCAREFQRLRYRRRWWTGGQEHGVLDDVRRAIDGGDQRPANGVGLVRRRSGAPVMEIRRWRPRGGSC